MSDECKACYGYNFNLIGCCSGRECGCMGQPVDSEPCPVCNKDGSKEPADQAKQDWPWFFLNEDEFKEYENKKTSLAK